MKRLSGVFLFTAAALAQLLIRPIRAAGIEVPAADRAELQAALSPYPGRLVRAGFFNEDWSL